VLEKKGPNQKNQKKNQKSSGTQKKQKNKKAAGLQQKQKNKKAAGLQQKQKAKSKKKRGRKKSKKSKKGGGNPTKKKKKKGPEKKGRMNYTGLDELDDGPALAQTTTLVPAKAPMFGAEVRTLDFDRVLSGRVEYTKKGAVEREMNPAIPALGDVRAAAEDRMRSTDLTSDKRLQQEVVGNIGASATMRMVSDAVARSVATGINADYTRHSFEGTVGAPSASATQKRHENAVAVTRGADGALDVVAARGAARATLGFAEHAEPTRRIVAERTDHAHATRPAEQEHGVAKFASVACTGNRGDENAAPVAGTRRTTELVARSETTRVMRSTLGALVGSERSVVGTSDRSEKPSIAVRRVSVVVDGSAPNRVNPDRALGHEATRDVRHASYTIQNDRQTALERGAEADRRLERTFLDPHRVPVAEVAVVADRHARIEPTERYAGSTTHRVPIDFIGPRTDRVGVSSTGEKVRFEAGGTHRVPLDFVGPRTDRVGVSSTGEQVRFEAGTHRVPLDFVGPRTDRVGVSSTGEQVRFEAGGTHRVPLDFVGPRMDRVGVSSAPAVRTGAAPVVHRVSLSTDGFAGPTAGRATTARLDPVFAAARATQVTLDAPRVARAPVECPSSMGAVDVGRVSYTTPFDTGLRGASNPSESRVACVARAAHRTALDVDFRRGEIHATRSAGSVGETKTSRVSVSSIEPTARAAPVLAHSAPFGKPTRGVHAREFEYDR
jgi:hypothetical protein